MLLQTATIPYTVKSGVLILTRRKEHPGLLL